MFNQFNEFLSNYINIISLMSSFAAVAALIISVIAFKKSNKKANLTLMYNVYDVQEKFYKEENGEIIFLQGEAKGIVSECRPGSELNIILANESDIVAKNPIMDFRFHNMEIGFKMGEPIGNWRGTEHNHGIGTWSGLRWEPKDNTVIHNGIPFSNTLCFSGALIQNDAYIQVILSADNMKTKKFKIPVEIK
ncbi:hypothetical protein GSQ51_03795 [Clostridioides difficile]|nr:hypothetical protein [Clostridioides difficile]NJK13222.1 hypothetical protein [Clostridioides difficile]